MLWGFYYFVLLVLEKKYYGEKLKKLPAFVQRIYTIFAVIIGWIFFYFEDMSNVGRLFKALIGVNGFSAAGDGTYIVNRIFLFAAAIIAVTPLASKCVKRVLYFLGRLNHGKEIVQIITIVFQVVTLFICVSCLVGSTYNPFLYFRF